MRHDGMMAKKRRAGPAPARAQDRRRAPADPFQAGVFDPFAEIGPEIDGGHEVGRQVAGGVPSSSYMLVRARSIAADVGAGSGAGTGWGCRDAGGRARSPPVEPFGLAGGGVQHRVEQPREERVQVALPQAAHLGGSPVDLPDHSALAQHPEVVRGRGLG
jgi:hypothetical protein